MASLTRCPKCNYQRTQTDVAPEWQCPSCQVVYAKAAQSTADCGRVYPPSTAPRPATGRSGLAIGNYVAKICFVLVFVAVVYGGYIFSLKMDMQHVEPSAVVVADKTVVVYSTARCGYCRKVKQFLDEKKIPFEEYDIEKSDKGKEDFEKMKGIGVPIVVVGDKVLQGYDEKALLSLLKYKRIINPF